MFEMYDKMSPYADGWLSGRALHFHPVRNGRLAQLVRALHSHCKGRWFESSNAHMIPLDDFKKLDIRIGKVISAEKVPDSDNLVKLVFDMGIEERQVLAGIAEVFPDPSVLVDHQMPVLINLEPRTMRGEVSNGMILAADSNGSPILLHPAQEVPPGSIVK